MAVMFFFFLCFGGLFSCDAQEAYDTLPEVYKKGVDLALENLQSHSGVKHHFLFFKSVVQSNIEPGFDVIFVYHNFYLKATKCQKGTIDSTSCQFRNDRPLIDCAVCYKTFQGNIEADPVPYVHCVHKPTLTEAMEANRVQHCNAMGYSSGVSTLLASTGNV